MGDETLITTTDSLMNTLSHSVAHHVHCVLRYAHVPYIPPSRPPKGMGCKYMLAT